MSKLDKRLAVTKEIRHVWRKIAANDNMEMWLALEYYGRKILLDQKNKSPETDHNKLIIREEND